MLQVFIRCALLCAVPQGAADAPPHRQFDFWVGEWSVQNRHLRADGTWTNGDVTRARITPVCGGKAVLEEWAGELHGSFMNGFSLRAYDPEEERWALLLNWTVDGNAGFGQLFGSFRHGRGEFFTPSDGRSLTRYTFSDALADTVRWDSSNSADAGQTWRTDWIMEFSRTRPASEVTQDLLFESDWTEGRLSPHAEARALDWMLGSWSGVQTDEAGHEREARLRCKLLNKDCLLVDVFESRERGAEDWDERLSVRGFVPQTGRWESWRVTEGDTVLRRFVGLPQVETIGFDYRAADGSDWREIIALEGDGQLRLETGRRASETEPFADTTRTILVRDE